MKMSTNTFKVLIRCAAIGEKFRRKDAIRLGGDSYVIDTLVKSGLITSTNGHCEITDDGYREMTEMQKLLDKVE